MRFKNFAFQIGFQWRSNNRIHLFSLSLPPPPPFSLSLSYFSPIQYHIFYPVQSFYISFCNEIFLLLRKLDSYNIYKVRTTLTAMEEEGIQCIKSIPRICMKRRLNGYRVGIIHGCVSYELIISKNVVFFSFIARAANRQRILFCSSRIAS